MSWQTPPKALARAGPPANRSGGETNIPPAHPSLRQARHKGKRGQGSHVGDVQTPIFTGLRKCGECQHGQYGTRHKCYGGVREPLCGRPPRPVRQVCKVAEGPCVIPLPGNLLHRTISETRLGLVPERCNTRFGDQTNAPQLSDPIQRICAALRRPPYDRSASIQWISNRDAPYE